MAMAPARIIMLLNSTNSCYELDALTGKRIKVVAYCFCDAIATNVEAFHLKL